jgi:hypothetical protein
MAFPTGYHVVVSNPGPERTLAGVVFAGADSLGPGETEIDVELCRFLRQLGLLDHSQLLGFTYTIAEDE